MRSTLRLVLILTSWEHPLQSNIFKDGHAMDRELVAQILIKLARFSR